MLTALAPVNPAFVRWNEKGWTREEADDAFCSIQEALLPLQNLPRE
jgi:hypothetical protein